MVCALQSKDNDHMKIVRAAKGLTYPLVMPLDLHGDGNNVVLRKHLGLVGVLSTWATQSLATCVTIEEHDGGHFPQKQACLSIDHAQQVVTLSLTRPAN